MSSTTSNSVLPPAKMAHVVLKTAQFEPMVAFYKAVLGARTAHENDNMSFLSYDEEHHRLAILRVPNHLTNDRFTSGIDHISFTFSNLKDLLTAYTQRKARGILPVWSTNHGPTISLYYVDPDGNKVETQIDCYDTPEEANAFVDSPEFAENPVGVDVDPDELLRRLEAGESESDLMVRPNIGPRDLSTVPVFTPAPARTSYDIIETTV
ncbi:putative ring-cleavage extradiol dioxygenase [Xylariales sp. PMI_506]|nr:putative ring-cleavage extradiol dioxygenase [Xylariales sp. PMI_506]